jgi:hypothetical protein
MGMFDNLKNMQEMMKGMSPGQLQEMMKQAGNIKSQMEDAVRKVVEEEIKKRELMSRADVEKMIEEKMKHHG